MDYCDKCEDRPAEQLGMCAPCFERFAAEWWAEYEEQVRERAAIVRTRLAKEPAVTAPELEHLTAEERERLVPQCLWCRRPATDPLGPGETTRHDLGDDARLMMRALTALNAARAEVASLRAKVAIVFGALGFDVDDGKEPSDGLEPHFATIVVTALNNQRWLIERRGESLESLRAEVSDLLAEADARQCVITNAGREIERLREALTDIASMGTIESEAQTQRARQALGEKP